jgi:hypothetical protein
VTISLTEAKYANCQGYTDVTPYEIVRRISEKTIEVRAMSAVIDPEWKPEVAPGGFCGHTVNNHAQRWLISPDAQGHTVRLRLTKQGWKGAGRMFALATEPRCFYDFNF